jgi:hypothetical protein
MGLLSHGVMIVFPDNLRGDLDLSPPSEGPFRKLTGTEINQYRYAAASDGDYYIWRCTSCPTRFHIEYKTGEDSELLARYSMALFPRGTERGE